MRTRIVFAAAACSVALAACSDSTAPNPANCERGALAIGALVQGKLDKQSCLVTTGSVAERHVDYKVALMAGNRYLFTLRSETAWHPVLDLINDAAPTTPPITGWFTDGSTSGSGAYAELMIVAPFSGTATLRIRGTDVVGSAYTLRSTACGGSPHEIFISGSVSTQGTIDATDCMIHDRWLESDSARAETFVLYLGRDEIKTVSVKARGASAGLFKPGIVVTGPYVLGGGSGSMRQVTYSSSDSLSMQVQGTSQAGDYIVAVTGRTPSSTGDYTLTIGPPTP